MAGLPTGTVTFLFTDIEGSTRLLQELGDAFPEARAEHHRVIREAVAAHGGVEVDTQGDAFFFAFERAPDAVAAAEEAQRALALPVRMGIHTGEPQLTDEGYIGIDVHVGARACAAAHGAQIVLTVRTRSLLDAGTRVRDLGLHRLKDLGDPLKLFQAGERNFPPLRSLNATNLPAQPSPLVGRERELAELRSLVADGERLVTLTGAGGTGKTRLALQAAADLVDDFPDGVFWVSLAALRDPELVVPTTEQTLGAKGPLAEHVDAKRLLVLLDNLEQLVECGPALAQVLARCPNLVVLVTSRMRLNVQGEREYYVPPLAEDEAIRLFRARAAVSEPPEAVVEICRRLDRLPLAIELAAARTRVLPPPRLLERLGQRLPLLKGGVRNAPERQQTLRATIEWSHDLLSEAERRLFAGLAVFPGSFSLAAAERVCAAELHTLESLIEQSLLRVTSEGRFFMLETIREFAAEQLESSGESAELARRHADWALDLAEAAKIHYNDGDTAQGHSLALPEQANLRSAAEWALSSDPELGLRLVAALELFWAMTDPQDSARRIAAALEHAPNAPAELRAHAFRALGGALNPAGDQVGAEDAYRRSLVLFEEIGDEREAAVTTFRLGATATNMGDAARARPLLEESLARLRALGERRVEMQIVGVLGIVSRQEGDLAQARALLSESAAHAGETGFVWWQGVMLANLVEAELEAGDYEEAGRTAREALKLARGISERQLSVYGLAYLACVAAGRGDDDRAARLWGAVEAEEGRGAIGGWEGDREALRRKLGPLDEPGLAQGRRLTLEEALEYAFADDV